jgi:hypothetical protein
MRALVTTVSNMRSCLEEGILAYGRLQNCRRLSPHMAEDKTMTRERGVTP